MPVFGLHQAPRAAAAAFDEVLDRVAARHDRAEVAREHGRVRRVAAEAATQEERAATAQQRADHRHVEVDAGRDVRDRIALVVHDVRQQQVVHVAAVARHVDDLAAFVDRLQAREVGEFDAVVEPVPQAAEHARREDDERVRIVGGDFVGVAARDLERVAPRDLLVPDLLAHGVAHCLRAQHLGHDRAPMREVGTDGRRTLVAELHAQLAPQPARAARHAARLRHRGLHAASPRRTAPAGCGR